MARIINFGNASRPSNYFGEALDSISNGISSDRRADRAEREQNKRFALQDARNARLDSLANARENRLSAQANREEERYKDAKAEKEANFLAKTQFQAPIITDSTESVTGAYDTGSQVDNYNNAKIADLYNKETEGMNREQLENFTFSLQKEPEKIKELEKIKLNERNLKIESAFKRIDVDPNITDREEAKNEFLRSIGMIDNKETDSTLDRLGKNIGEPLSLAGRMFPALARSIVGLSSQEKAKEMSKKQEEADKEYVDYYKIDKNQREIAEEKIETLNKNRARNIKIDEINTEDKLKAKEAFNKRLDEFKLDGQTNQTMIDTRIIPIEDKIVLADIDSQANARMQEIKAQNLPKETERAQLLSLISIREKAIAQHMLDRKKTDKEKIWKRDEQAKINIQKMKNKAAMARANANKAKTPIQKKKAEADLKKVLLANKKAEKENN